jgi:hypothetical protein
VALGRRYGLCDPVPLPALRFGHTDLMADEEFVVPAGVGVEPADEAAPHAAIIEREGRRARHAVTNPVVSAKALL